MRDRDKYKVLAEKDHQLWPRYRKLRNRVTAELRKSVKTYYQGLIDETSNNPKEMWKSVNKVLNKDKTRTFPSSVTYKGQNLENPSGISEAFNDHFVTIGPNWPVKYKVRLQMIHCSIYLQRYHLIRLPSYSKGLMKILLRER